MQNWIQTSMDRVCVLSVISNGNVNDYDNANNIIFIINDTKLFVTVLTLLARDNQKSWKLLSKGF